MEWIYLAEKRSRYDSTQESFACKNQGAYESDSQKIFKVYEKSVNLLRKSGRPGNIKLAKKILQGTEWAYPAAIDPSNEKTPYHRQQQNRDADSTEKNHSAGKENVLKNPQRAVGSLYEETKDQNRDRLNSDMSDFPPVPIGLSAAAISFFQKCGCRE